MILKKSRLLKLNLITKIEKTICTRKLNTHFNLGKSIIIDTIIN